MRTESTLTIGTLAELVRAGVVQPERLTPELQQKLAAYERGDIAESKGKNEYDENEEDDA